MEKIIIRNSITESLKDPLKVDFKGIREVDEDEFFNPDSEFYLPALSDVGLLVCGYDLYQRIRDLHNKGYIHIGLRNFNYNTVKNIDIVSIGNNLKFIFTDGITEKKKPDWEKLSFFINERLDRKIPVIKQYEIVDLKDAEDVILRLETINPAEEFYGFDTETRNFPLTADFKLLGFSLVGSEYGVYIDTRNYTDYFAPEYDFIRKWIEDNYKRLVTYNCAFEMRVIEHMWSEMLLLPDAWALCLCDDERSNLKTEAQHYLHVPSWDDALSFEQTYLDKVMWGGEYQGIRYESCPSPEVYFQRLKMPEYSYYRDGLVRVMDDCIERRVIDQHIPEDKIPEFSREIKQGYKERILHAWGNSWEMCDPWTLGKYCIYDSYYTKLIWDKLHGQYPRAEEPYHNNYYYGAFLEATGIPINREKLLILEDYLDNIQINTGVFYVKFYLDCLEKTVGEYVDSLELSGYTQELMVNYPWLLKENPDKVLKEILKLCYSEGKMDWKGYAKIVSKDIAKEIWEMTSDDYKDGHWDPSVATRKHRKEWVKFGDEYQSLTHYLGIIEKINDRNLDIARDGMKRFNKEVIDFVKPFNPVTTKLCAQWVDDPPKIPGQGIKRYAPWDVKKVHPETQKCFDFVWQLKEAWDKDQKRKNYLGGRDLKKLKAYVTKEDLEWYRHVYNIHEAIPPILLRECNPLELISVEEVSNLLQLRNLKKELDLWDEMKVDQPYPGKADNRMTRGHAKWLALDLVQWSSDKKTFVVTISMLKRFGWLCSAITQFWNYWWSKDHVPEEDPEVLKYAISSALEDESMWLTDVLDYIYQAGDHGKKAERSVGVVNFSIRFGFERWEIRQWLPYNVNKDTLLSLEKDDNRLHEDWKNLYKFFIYWDMGQGADKQLNPYISGDKGMIANSWKLDRILPDGSEIIDYSEHGDRFMTHFKICGVSVCSIAC